MSFAGAILGRRCRVVGVLVKISDHGDIATERERVALGSADQLSLGCGRFERNRTFR
jgi:hypothetical protein